MSEPLWSVWWIWIAASLFLAIVEVLAPGYVFLGFAAGALAVGLLLLNTGMDLSLSVLLLIFAGLSLIAWLVMRRLFALDKGSVKTFDRDIND